MKKLLYIRVSKEDEKEQNPEDQIPVILHTFKLNKKDCDILIERASAYTDNKQYKRTAFAEAKEKIERGEVKEVYVYSLERFERNIKRMLEFYFFCERNDCSLYSALQPYINNLLPKTAEKALNKNPIYVFLKYLMVLIYSFLAENESYFIGVRTRKSFQKIKNSTYSKDGNKVGNKFVNSSGVKVNLTMKKENDMYEFIVVKITDYEKRRIGGYYPLIISKVKDNFDIVLSRAYLSTIKKRLSSDGSK